jgi:hypothetical protein
MLAADFTRAAVSARGGEGIKCAKCGKRSAWRTEAQVEGNPLLGGFDAKQYTDRTTIASSIEELNSQIGAVQAKLGDPGVLADKAQKRELEQQLEALYLKRSALDERWDEIDAQQHAP